MQSESLARVAAVLAEPARAAMCLALLDGRAWTVGELARAAGVAPSTASEHVARLTEAGFLTGARQGRHRYVRLADAEIADLVERLAQHAEQRPVVGLRPTLRARRLAFARTCYDHLAGALGVALREGMVSRGLVDTSTGLALTSRGRSVLDELGVVVADTARSRRPVLRDCLDWTERREHLAGAVPAALLSRAVAAGWLAVGEHREVRVQPSARQPLSVLGVRVEELVAGAEGSG
ncbi:ArsR/SmtB family transcription factor [Goodfellowiella coeruleoviolacea]|uniref:ArsR/SmtB family transcription factor n=1 Tax=Goodfellowiella coeruleoviolacea TaxID=334858 RepID=UPI0020A349E1|nr:winged helix-turn-helix domain-containing protein [Goodfellowiella coeruleoviolacea]